MPAGGLPIALGMVVSNVGTLAALGKLLGVDDHLVYAVAKGKPAEQMYKLIATPAGRKELVKTITVRYTTGKLALAKNPLNI